MGWSDSQPEFAHLPLLLKPTGKGKLSKRDGDKMGFPVFPLEWHAPDGETAHGYREDGYFAEAFVNMLALLGWNPGDDREILSMEELIEAFSLEHCGKSGSRFDPEKARWFNGQYLKTKSDAELAQLYAPILEEKGVVAEMGKIEKVCGLIKERATFVSDFWNLSDYFFVAPAEFEEKAVAKFWKGENPNRLKALREVIAGVEEFRAETLEHAIHSWIEQNELPMGQVMNTFRLAVVGRSMGPSMMEIAEFIGREETIQRIDSALDKLGNPAQA